MKLTISKSRNVLSLYEIKYIYVNGIGTYKIVEKLGFDNEYSDKLYCKDIFKKYIDKYLHKGIYYE